MRRTTARRRIRTRAVVLGSTAAGTAALIGAANLVVRVGDGIDGRPQGVRADPVAAVLDLFVGATRWTDGMTLVASLLGAGVLVVGAAALVVAVRIRARRTRVDYAASHLGRGGDVRALTERAATAAARRLGVDGAAGLRIGVTLRGGRPLVAGWEDMWVVIAGPRTGKSTAVAVPSIAAAPGAVLATSNKPDVVQATRRLRAERGRVWVFDPQDVANEPASWWWNPLSVVDDDVSAAELAAHFANGSRQPGAQTDAFFDPAGRDLLAGLLLAASCADRPITQVPAWLADPEQREPVALLRAAGWAAAADAVEGVVSAPDKQRGGVYGTAQQMAACLGNSRVRAWITRSGTDDDRAEFDHRAFAESSDTLYSLSREGEGSAGPVVLALTAAVAQAADRAAARRPAGRLAVPMLAVLDEAANVCRWAALPDLYSHYGSRGILIQTVLQSWSQGCEVWTEAGMNKLWSASNIKLYLGGVAETGFLEQLSQTLGERELRTESVTRGSGVPSVAVQHQTERILTVAELAALPRGRAVLIASGSRPVLVRTVPWWEGPYAERVRASVAAASDGESSDGTTGRRA